MQGECFICGIKSAEFDRNGAGWTSHKKAEHNMWEYLYFFIHLDYKEATEYSYLEHTIAGKIVANEYDFFPVSQSLSLNQTGDDDSAGPNSTAIAAASDLLEAYAELQQGQNKNSKVLAQIAELLRVGGGGAGEAGEEGGRSSRVTSSRVMSSRSTTFTPKAMQGTRRSTAYGVSNCPSPPFSTRHHCHLWLARANVAPPGTLQCPRFDFVGHVLCGCSRNAQASGVPTRHATARSSMTSRPAVSCTLLPALERVWRRPATRCATLVQIRRKMSWPVSRRPRCSLQPQTMLSVCLRTAVCCTTLQSLAGSQAASSEKDNFGFGSGVNVAVQPTHSEVAQHNNASADGHFGFEATAVAPDDGSTADEDGNALLEI